MAQLARVPSTRLVDDATARGKLGPLRELGGTWEGRGFNLIARPDFHDKTNLYLQLNQTHETLTVTPIGSSIPNRGFGQDDIELFGLSYLQKINDHSTGGALHLEPGLWITQPPTTYPPEHPPPNGCIIARMASIPHGNAVLAQGSATPFTGPPTLPPPAGTKLQAGAQIYNGSKFRSFNSTPFSTPCSTSPPVINADGSSERRTPPQIRARPFKEYDLLNNPSATCRRTPVDTSPKEPDLPTQIDDVPMQHVINDPIRLLQAEIRKQVREGHTFEGWALNIATRPAVTFRLLADEPTGLTVNIPVTGAGGGIENILFLEGAEQGPNAETRLVYATFWIEKVTSSTGHHFMQLQYAQMAVLIFPVFTLLHPPGGSAGELVKLGWPHISVATLRKAF